MATQPNLIVLGYIDIIFFLFLKIYFLYHQIKIIQKYQKILI